MTAGFDNARMINNTVGYRYYVTPKTYIDGRVCINHPFKFAPVGGRSIDCCGVGTVGSETVNGGLNELMGTDSDQKFVVAEVDVPGG